MDIEFFTAIRNTVLNIQYITASNIWIADNWNWIYYRNYRITLDT